MAWEYLYNLATSSIQINELNQNTIIQPIQNIRRHEEGEQYKKNLSNNKEQSQITQNLLNGGNSFPLQFEIPNPGLALHSRRSQYHALQVILQKVLDQNPSQSEIFDLLFERINFALGLSQLVELPEGFDVDVSSYFVLDQFLVVVESFDGHFRANNEILIFEHFLHNPPRPCLFVDIAEYMVNDVGENVSQNPMGRLISVFMRLALQKGLRFNFDPIGFFQLQLLIPFIFFRPQGRTMRPLNLLSWVVYLNFRILQLLPRGFIAPIKIYYITGDEVASVAHLLMAPRVILKKLSWLHFVSQFLSLYYQKFNFSTKQSLNPSLGFMYLPFSIL